MSSPALQPRLLVVAGHNGSGKTTVTERGLARRVMQGGHDVPITKIVSRYFKSIANCALIAPEVHRLYLYDNSVDGVEPKLILRASEGKIVKDYAEAPAWIEPIIASLS